MSVCEQPVNFQVENNNDTNIDTSVNGILRIAASPLNIKTQIAKMSYNSGNKTLKKRCLNKQTSCLNEEDNSTGPELKTLNKTDPLATEENEKEEQEEKQKGLDTYLTENTYKPIQKIILAENDKHISDKNRNVSGETVPMFRRSKTEIIENKLGSQSERRQLKREGAKIRSKSCRLPETKSDDLLPSVTENKKRKSYNVEETRKFLEDQKRRRRSHIPTSTLKLDTGKTNIEKEQIKKRLEELRKNSRAIIAKNVNRKKCPVISQINIKNGGKKSTGDKAKTEHSLRKDKLSSNCELSKKTSETVDDCSDLLKGLKSLCTAKIHNEPEQQLPIKVSQMHKEKTKVKSPNSPYLLNKRIGLLRKQETKDHSFSAIREFSFDKDNIALEMMTPKLRESVPLNPKTVSNSTDLDARRNDFPDKTKESMTIVNESKLKCLLTDEISKENNISSMKESGTKPHIKMDNKVNTIPEKDLPYWLKPSTVQIYQYNFIMAVRRKLEALADVRTQPTGFDMEPKSCFATKDLSLKNKAKGEIILSKGTDSARSEESLLTHNVIPFEQKNSNSKESCMNSHSEIHSNLSSISIKLRSESTVSESVLKDPKSIPLTYAKSKVFEATSEDDTTISSSIFNSADRNIHDKNNIDSSRKEELQGTISPLSLERVENLTIMSNKKLKTAIAIRHVNTNRGDTPTNNKEDTADIDFNRLLHDFNNSLSQVIEVNDRLKATINKSQEICGSIPTDSCNSKQSDQYTADFEKNCSDQSLISPCGNNDIKPHKDHIKDAFDDQKKYDYSKLESVALGSKDSDDSPSKASNPNSKSYTNSSLSSRNSNGQYEILSLSKEDLDKRLHKIRNIKEKYKQIIINLQKNRNKDESLKQYLTPANISERKENEILSKKMEDEEKKTNSEIKVQCETLNPSYFISCHKSPDTPIRNQIKANQQHFASKI
ncbi:unnamed protein product [Ceratitis capitata]|uniref:(Mediterranean fruit fly) hypothetical protein n=1 Tax=Ceratitis capitata TaxID=7213 RepID=A0A811UIT6_CERCA|nr:unnamed protein product [Ceratitis capitata]